MNLIKNISSYKMNNMEELIELRILVEKEIDMLCSIEDVFLPQCAFSEAFNNAAIHGEFPINVDLNRVNDDKFLIRIKDSRKGFPAHEQVELIQKKGADQLLEEGIYDENGRGICIMYKSVCEIKYNERGNEVSLVISNSKKIS